MASVLIVENTEAAKTGIVERLAGYGVQATKGTLPLDYAWTAQGKAVMGDSKTPSDLIASVSDGRLYAQMEAAGDGLAFIFLRGPVSEDGGFTVGDRNHAWDYDAFDNLLLSLQLAGVKIVNCPRDDQVARRLASFYKWTDREEHTSWHNVKRPTALRLGGADYRAKVAMVMSLPGCGQKKAEQLVKAYGLMGSLGITAEGLVAAEQRWSAVRGVGPTLVTRWRRYLEG